MQMWLRFKKTSEKIGEVHSFTRYQERVGILSLITKQEIEKLKRLIQGSEKKLYQEPYILETV